METKPRRSRPPGQKSKQVVREEEPGESEAAPKRFTRRSTMDSHLSDDGAAAAGKRQKKSVSIAQGIDRGLKGTAPGPRKQTCGARSYKHVITKTGELRGPMRWCVLQHEVTRYDLTHHQVGGNEWPA